MNTTPVLPMKSRFAAMLREMEHWISEQPADADPDMMAAARMVFRDLFGMANNKEVAVSTAQQLAGNTAALAAAKTKAGIRD